MALDYANPELQADDIVQEATIRMAGNPERFVGRVEREQMAYLGLIVRGTALNMNKKLARERKLLYDYLEESEDASLPSAEDDYMRLVDSEILEKAISQLEERDQLLLIGKDKFCLSDAELGQMLGCKPNNIRMMVRRARAKAVRKILKEGYTREEA